ncbi:TUBE [Mytilus edulis]|uniref:TUBE n=1 Tax=Mytilus edulis TaxID=6550 RepID=A0A8S3T647_MYTED|nr:TUBE [Mytilus edulis]
MTQSIVVQVGQCGNQIGCRFWDLALREHAAVNKSGNYDESLSSFFRNVDSRYDDPANIPMGSGKGKIKALKARAVLVDMEEGVVSEMMKGPLREVFDFQQLITDVSGCGNNWAVGHKMYGTQYREQLSDVIRRAAEFCDCLQCFFILHSMGGGTGSGVGTFILNLLEEEYPDVYRFVTAVYPSAEDDVVTSPYNSVLAMHQLTEKADCVLPVENQALMDIVNKIGQAIPSARTGKKTFFPTDVKAGSAIHTGDGGLTKTSEEKPFDSMNNIVANLLLNMTSGQVPAEAESNFLKKASTLIHTGVDPHQVKDQKGTSLYLGVTHQGIMTFHGSRRTQLYKWPQIKRIIFEGKMFILHVSTTEFCNNIKSSCQLIEKLSCQKFSDGHYHIVNHS